MDGSGAYDISTLPGRKRAIKYLHIIALGVSDDQLPADPLGRGREALHIMTLLSYGDPFKRIRSSNLEELQLWVKETHELTRELSWILQTYFSRLLPLINQFLVAFEAQMGQRFGAPFNVAKLRDFPQLFAQQVLKADAFADQLGSYLDDAAAFRKRRLAKMTLLGSRSLLGMAFLSGIIMPLVWAGVWRAFMLVIPIICYVILFSLLFLQIGRA
jgi:hypothetical protein